MLPKMASGQSIAHKRYSRLKTCQSCGFGNLLLVAQANCRGQYHFKNLSQIHSSQPTLKILSRRIWRGSWHHSIQSHIFQRSRHPVLVCCPIHRNVVQCFGVWGPCELSNGDSVLFAPLTITKRFLQLPFQARHVYAASTCASHCCSIQGVSSIGGYLAQLRGHKTL